MYKRQVQSRGGKGLLNYHVEKYGDVAAIKVVDLEDDIILIASDGVIIRIRANSIRECARPSKGVRVMRLTEGSQVVTLARTAHEDDEDQDELPEDVYKRQESGHLIGGRASPAGDIANQRPLPVLAGNPQSDAKRPNI